ncbi:MAG: GNAT family N-acetyltransferase [Flavisolibacter sp.]
MANFYMETDRLWLLPLSYGQLRNYLSNDGSLEKELGIQWISRKIHPLLQETLENTLLPSLEGNEKDHFFTLWTMISKTHHCMVGDLCFKGEPCADGGVEIGYGIYPAFERKGYTTEAVEVLCHWALGQKYVRFVRAETERENIASQKVLQKNGFVYMGEREGSRQWLLKPGNFSLG